jgi:phosphopantetheinyl transferase
MLIPIEFINYKTNCCCAFSSYELDEAEKLAFEYLSLNEHKYLANIHNNKPRLTFILSRIAAKQALQHLYDIYNPQLIDIQHGIFNQPIVICDSKISPGISISHINKLGAAIAFQNHYPMGIDIEVIKPEYLDIIKPYLSTAEMNILSIVGDTISSFTIAWTIKEALSKVLKTGLTTPLSIYEISKINAINGMFVAKFKHFPQYKAISMIQNNIAFSLVIPQQLQLKQSNILLDFNNISASLS